MQTRYVFEEGVTTFLGRRLAGLGSRCLGPGRPALALVPTVVSSNACVSSLAVMYGDDGLPSGFWRLDRPPELVAVDPQLVASASPRLLASALGARPPKHSWTTRLTSSMQSLGTSRSSKLYRASQIGPDAKALAVDRRALVIPWLEGSG